MHLYLSCRPVARRYLSGLRVVRYLGAACASNAPDNVDIEGRKGTARRVCKLQNADCRLQIADVGAWRG
eukprot:1276342-Prymnesium_polylepis.1